MKFLGVKCAEFEAQVAAIHEEAMAKVLEMNCAWVMNGHAAPQLARLEVELSGRLATCAGRAETNILTKACKVKLNYRLLKGKPEAIRATYLHELAHVVAALRYEQRMGHGRHWKAIAVALGDDGARCHSLDVSHLRAKRKPPVRVPYACACRGWMLTPRSHAKAEERRTRYGYAMYQCPKCKTKLKQGTYGEAVAA